MMMMRIMMRTMMMIMMMMMMRIMLGAHNVREDTEEGRIEVPH